MLNQLIVISEVFMYILLINNGRNVINAAEVNTNPQYYCPDFQPQKSLDLDQLMGMWYGIEVIQHRSDQGHIGSRRLETCPVLHFSRYRLSELQLFWNENAGTVEYQFHIPNPANPGFWMSFGPQNGTKTHDFTNFFQFLGSEFNADSDYNSLNQQWGFRLNNTKGTLVQNKLYRQFAGTVQVMKAVASHMVLTFCSPNTQLFSVILSRTTWLDKIEVRGVRNMLQRRSLNQFGINETNCNNAASILRSHQYYTPIVLLVAVLISKYFSNH